MIELYKENGIVKKVKPRYFEMKKASISEYEGENETYDIINI